MHYISLLTKLVPILLQLSLFITTIEASDEGVDIDDGKTLNVNYYINPPSNVVAANPRLQQYGK